MRIVWINDWLVVMRGTILSLLFVVVIDMILVLTVPADSIFLLLSGFYTLAALIIGFMIDYVRQRRRIAQRYSAARQALERIYGPGGLGRY